MRDILIIRTDKQRRMAVEKILKLPEGWAVEFRPPNRSLDQNARMWSMLHDLSKQLEWGGVKLSPEDWKLVMLAGLGEEIRMVPNVERNGYVPLGVSTSKLSVARMRELIDFISYFGAQHNVTFKAETLARV